MCAKFANCLEQFGTPGVFGNLLDGLCTTSAWYILRAEFYFNAKICDANCVSLCLAFQPDI